MAETIPDQKYDVGWAAGFFEGEGSAHVGSTFTAGKEYQCLRLQLTQVHKEPLDTFAKVVGAGTVRGPYGPYAGNRQPHYQWNASGQEAIPVTEMLLPYLFAKGDQVRAAVATYMEYWNDRIAA